MVTASITYGYSLSKRQHAAACCSLEEVRGVAAAAEKAGPCKADFAAVAFPV